MAIVRKRIVAYEGDPLPEEVIREVEEAYRRPIVYDEDCPPLTDQELEKAAAIVRERDANRKREPLSLEVLPATSRVAKQYGKNFMARLLDMAVRDEALMKKCM